MQGSEQWDIHINGNVHKRALKSAAKKAARDAYLPVRNGWETVESFWAQHGKHQRLPDDAWQAQRTMLLLKAQLYQQYSFTSCGFF